MANLRPQAQDIDLLLHVRRQTTPYASHMEPPLVSITIPLLVVLTFASIQRTP